MKNRRDDILKNVNMAVLVVAAAMLFTALPARASAEAQVIINNEVWNDGDWSFDSNTTIYSYSNTTTDISYESNTYYDYDYSYSTTTTYYPGGYCYPGTTYYYTYPVTEYVYVEPSCSVSTYTCYGEPGLFYDGRVVSSGENIMPCSASRYLTQAEINSLTLKGLCYAKNEIFARHGRTFASNELQNYFNGRTWYCGTNRNDDAIYASFNSYEIANVDALAAAERAMGMYPVS